MKLNASKEFKMCAECTESRIKMIKNHVYEHENKSQNNFINFNNFENSKNTRFRWRFTPKLRVQQCRWSFGHLTYTTLIVAYISSLLTILSLSNEVLAFNLETRLPIVKYGERADSYFGYSVAMHTVGEYNWPNNTKWLLVGAPLGKNLQPGTNRTGALYKCPITQNLHDCVQIITDGRRSYDSDDVEELTEPSYDEIKEGQWLGVTVRSQGLGGKVLVCAHRYITKIRENRLGQGLCYLLTNDLKFDETYEPCKGRTVHRGHEDYAFCQSGTSGALLDDNTMILGSPGPFTWRGTVFITEVGGEYLERDKSYYYGDHSDASSVVDKYSYLGMAVTGGRYFGDRMSYAAGAPRSNGSGQVVIFNKGHSNPIPVEMIIDGEQFGSSFGYQLTTADINGDQKPDLIVAAPVYFTKKEGGAVYVYQNDNDELPYKATIQLTGVPESRFGLGLANIGDINKDNCEDLAVGAPYEGAGVVYIYLGGRTGLNTKPSQRIPVSDFGVLPQPLSAFGISISGGTDIDGNSYPDVLIGAYGSAAAVALLSRPIISIQTSWRSSEIQSIDPTKQGCITDPFSNLTCFTFEACCSIDPYEETTRTDLRLMYTVEAETFDQLRKFSRVFFDRDDRSSHVIKREISVRTNGRQECQRVTGYIKENTRDIQSPIRFRLNYTLVEPKLPHSGLQGLNPILDQMQADIKFQGIFQKDCGDDDRCESDLKLEAELDLDMEDGKYALILGEQEEIRVSINISNYADSAYDSHLYIVHQKSVSYIAPFKMNTVICNQFNDTVVSCHLGNPIPRDKSIKLGVRFDPIGLEATERVLTFRIFANTTSKLISDIQPEAKFDVIVAKRVDLSLRAWIRPEQNFYSGEIKPDTSFKNLNETGPHVFHTYQLYNDGPWKAPKISVNIYWPQKVYSKKDEKEKFLLYLEDIPTIENVPLSECYVMPDHVNPLKLSGDRWTNILEELEAAPAAYMMRLENRPFSTHSNRQRESLIPHKEIDKNPTEIIDVNRIKRDMLERVMRPERLMEAKMFKSKNRDIIELDCNKGTASCIKIHCEIIDMPAKSEAYIHVKARLWNSTLVSEFPRVDLVRIVSTAYVHIPPEYGVEQLNPDDHILVETHAYPELLDQSAETGYPLWIIILAIIGGLLLLGLFTFGLYLCGFFKRKRPDADLILTGNLEKSEEKPFLNGKNGKKKERVF